MYTTCPECGTVFRIAASDLRVADGFVRCGHCSATFNALLSLSDTPPEDALPPAPEPPRSAADPTAPVAPEQELIGAAVREEWADADFSLADADSPPSGPQASADGAPDQNLLDQDSLAAERPSTDEPRDTSVDDDDWDALLGEVTAEDDDEAGAPVYVIDEPAVVPVTTATVGDSESDTPEPELAGAGAETTDSSESAPISQPGAVSATVDELPDEPVWEDFEAPEVPTREVVIISADSIDAVDEDDVEATSDVEPTSAQAPRPPPVADDGPVDLWQAAMTDADSERGEPGGVVVEGDEADFERAFVWSPPARPVELPEERPAARWYAWGSAALALLLAAQIVHDQRDALATSPTWGQTIRRLYGAVDAPLYPAWDLSTYEVRGSEAVAGRSAQGALDVVARVRVVGSEPTGLPLVRVTLRDRWSNVIGTDVFPPRVYLGGQSEPELLKPGSTLPIRISLADPGAAAYGYEVDICLETRTLGLRCQFDRNPFRGPTQQ